MRMRIHSINFVAVALALLAGCAGTPVQNKALDEARAAYDNAADGGGAVGATPRVSRYAPVALKEAEEALRTAEARWQAGAAPAEVDHLAYLAKQKVAIAVERAKINAAEDEVNKARAERDKVMLEARVHQAESAQRQAERARAEAESLARELAELKARGTERGAVLTLGDVLFDFDRAELNPGGQRVATQLSDFLQRHAERNVLIEGFTDSVGPDDYNLRLSERRSNSVRLALINRGIDPGRIAIRGYGEAYPVASNASEAGRQRNRRVEVIISDTKGRIPERTQ